MIVFLPNYLQKMCWNYLFIGIACLHYPSLFCATDLLLLLFHVALMEYSLCCVKLDIAGTILLLSIVIRFISTA